MRRTFYSIIVVVAVLAVGTEMIHVLEGRSYVDSLYRQPYRNCRRAVYHSKDSRSEGLRIASCIHTCRRCLISTSLCIWISSRNLDQDRVRLLEREEEKIENRLEKKENRDRPGSTGLAMLLADD
jgi:hypothetical protein